MGTNGVSLEPITKKFVKNLETPGTIIWFKNI